MNELIEYVNGNLSPAQRVWTAAAPALVIVGVALGGAVAFGIRNKIAGEFHDEEIENRGSSLVLGMWVRRYFAWFLSPLIRLLLALRIPPSAITLLSVQLAVGSAFALAAGRMALGGWLFMLAGACDFFDGRLARASGRANKWGAVLDSVVDRYVEGIAYIGLAWFYRSNWVLLVVLFAWFGSVLVPYVRARGEALGVRMSGSGFMQRPERMVILSFCVALSPILEAIWVPGDPHPPHRLAIAGMAFLAITSQVSALQRLAHARSELSSGPSLQQAGFGWSHHTSDLVVAAIAASLVDIALVVWLVRNRDFQLPVATLLGCALGYGVRFAIHRVLTVTHGCTEAMSAGRYAIVSASSSGLNALLVALLLLLDPIPAAVAWLAVRGLVAATWNYPLFSDYVFRPSPSPTH